MSAQTLLRADIALPGGGEAVYNASGLQWYRRADQLGSARLISSPGGGALTSIEYTPYGFDAAGSGTGYRSFTGAKQDIDYSHSGGQYDFLMRKYNPIQGRWWTPDPAGLAAVDPSDPQSWNRYAYVDGTPLEATDPLGLIDVDTNPDDPCAYLSRAEGDPSCADLPGYFDDGATIYALLTESGGGGGYGGGGGLPAQAPGNPPEDFVSPNQAAARLRSWWQNLSRLPWLVNWILPVYPAPVVAGVGPAGSIAWDPATRTLCFGAGIGASAGHEVTGGPIAGVTWDGKRASPPQLDKILSGGSVGVGINTPPFGPGGQVAANTAGAVYGPTVGVGGASAAATDSLCVHLPGGH